MDTQTVLLGGLSDDLLLGCDGCDSQMAGLGSPFAEKGASGGLTATQAGVVTSANPLARVATAQARARELATKNARAAELNRTAAAKLQKEGKGVLAQQAANQSLQATADAARYAAAAKGYEGAKKLAASAEQAERKGDARAASGFRAALGTMLTAVNKTLSTPIAAGADGPRGRARVAVLPEFVADDDDARRAGHVLEAALEDGVIGGAHLAAGLQGAIVKDEEKDKVLQQDPPRGRMIYSDRKVVLWVSRESYIKWLPAIYQRSDTTGRNVVRDLLWIIQHLFGSIEQVLETMVPAMPAKAAKAEDSPMPSEKPFRRAIRQDCSSLGGSPAPAKARTDRLAARRSDRPPFRGRPRG